MTFLTTFAGYMPMDCPSCGRRRLEATLASVPSRKDASVMVTFVLHIQCEKCYMSWGNEERDEDDDHWEGVFGEPPWVQADKDRWRREALELLIEMHQEET